ncbi:PepSY-associated TM helix domain-containing protein [Methylomonas sp. AM2-LC]|uniref:PepSY-associated TM helix domain-containing protein n=1 Tax=Methylomonas sp. AM2-LC TaxID=3153301 RepID=UPI003263F94A
MNTSTKHLQILPSRPHKKTVGGYLFLPKRITRSEFLKWLRRTHAWFGLWAAAMGLLFGITGILLNHRDILKIPIGRMEQQEILLALPDPRPVDPKAMAAWLGESLGINTFQAKIRSEPPKTVIWNNQSIQQPGNWQIIVRNPQRMLSAEYWEGNAFISVKQGNANFLTTLNNLHKGVGMSIGWVLLVDSFAGALLLLSVTGTLLWTRLHGNRLIGVSLALGSMSLAIFFVMQSIMA